MLPPTAQDRLSCQAQDRLSCHTNELHITIKVFIYSLTAPYYYKVKDCRKICTYLSGVSPLATSKHMNGIFGMAFKMPQSR